MQKGMKGYLFNLIIYTHEKRRSEYFHHIVHEFIEKYPCRVIFIQGDKQTTDIRTQKIEDRNTCDQLIIKTSPSCIQKVPFVILPYIIPDLPIYLVWGQNPMSDNPILPYLEKLATRLVYDSECSKNLQEFSRKVLAKIENLTIDFMDVNWAQICGWRDVIAQTFHSVEKLDQLNRVPEILIKYNKIDDPLIKHAAIQAIYLQGWLAAQLKWEYQSITCENNNIVLEYLSQKKPIKVILQPQERPTLVQGQIFEITFNDPQAISTTLTLAEKQSKVMVYLSTSEKCELPFSLPIRNIFRGLTAMKEIFYNRSSPHYSNMLRILSTIQWKEY